MDRGGASRNEPVVLGLAGGIGSGKSRVAAEFARLGWLVFDFDAMTREALASSEIAATVAEWWGTGVLDAQGQVDRAVVGKIVFDDAQQRRRLEALIHPKVWRTRAEAIEAATSAGAPGVIFDAPLLFEAGLDSECDAVVFVDADQALREARVRAGRGWSAADLARREAAQWPIEEKRRRSRFILDNSSGPESLARRVAEVVAMMELSGQRGGPPGPDA